MVICHSSYYSLNIDEGASEITVITNVRTVITEEPYFQLRWF
jgi:hypothetical protein